MIWKRLLQGLLAASVLLLVVSASYFIFSAPYPAPWTIYAFFGGLSGAALYIILASEPNKRIRNGASAFFAANAIASAIYTFTIGAAINRLRNARDLFIATVGLVVVLGISVYHYNRDEAWEALSASWCYYSILVRQLAGVYLNLSIPDSAMVLMTNLAAFFTSRVNIGEPEVQLVKDLAPLLASAVSEGSLSVVGTGRNITEDVDFQYQNYSDAVAPFSQAQAVVSHYFIGECPLYFEYLSIINPWANDPQTLTQILNTALSQPVNVLVGGSYYVQKYANDPTEDNRLLRDQFFVAIASQTDTFLASLGFTGDNVLDALVAARDIVLARQPHGPEPPGWMEPTPSFFRRYTYSYGEIPGLPMECSSPSAVFRLQCAQDEIDALNDVTPYFLTGAEAEAEEANCEVYQNFTWTSSYPGSPFGDELPGCLECDTGFIACPPLNNGWNASTCQVEVAAPCNGGTVPCPCNGFSACGACSTCDVGYDGTLCDQCADGYTDCGDLDFGGTLFPNCTENLDPTPYGTPNACTGEFTCANPDIGGDLCDECIDPTKTLCDGGVCRNGTDCPADPLCAVCDACVGTCETCVEGAVNYTVTGMCMDQGDICVAEGVANCAKCQGFPPFDCQECDGNYTLCSGMCVHTENTCKAACGATIAACNPCNAPNTCNVCPGSQVPCSDTTFGVCTCREAGDPCPVLCETVTPLEPGAPLPVPDCMVFSGLFDVARFAHSSLNMSALLAINSDWPPPLSYAETDVLAQHWYRAFGRFGECVTNYGAVIGLDPNAGHSVTSGGRTGTALIELYARFGIVSGFNGARGRPQKETGREVWSGGLGRAAFLKSNFVELGDNVEDLLNAYDPTNLSGTFAGAGIRAGAGATLAGTQLFFLFQDVLEDSCTRIDINSDKDLFIAQLRIIIDTAVDFVQGIDAPRVLPCGNNAALDLLCTAPELFGAFANAGVDALDNLAAEQIASIVCGEGVDTDAVQDFVTTAGPDVLQAGSRLLLGAAGPLDRTCGGDSSNTLKSTGANLAYRTSRIITVAPLDFLLRTVNSADASLEELFKLMTTEPVLLEVVPFLRAAGFSANCLDNRVVSSATGPGGLVLQIADLVELGTDFTDLGLPVFIAGTETVIQTVLLDFPGAVDAAERFVDETADLGEQIGAVLLDIDLKPAFDVVEDALNEVIGGTRGLCNFFCAPFIGPCPINCASTFTDVHFNFMATSNPHLMAYYTQASADQLVHMSRSVGPWEGSSRCDAVVVAFVASNGTSGLPYDVGLCVYLRRMGQALVAKRSDVLEGVGDDLLYSSDFFIGVANGLWIAATANDTQDGTCRTVDCLVRHGVPPPYAAVTSRIIPIFTEQTERLSAIKRARRAAGGNTKRAFFEYNEESDHHIGSVMPPAYVSDKAALRAHRKARKDAVKIRYRNSEDVARRMIREAREFTADDSCSLLDRNLPVIRDMLTIIERYGEDTTQCLQSIVDALNNGDPLPVCEGVDPIDLESEARDLAALLGTEFPDIPSINLVLPTEEGLEKNHRRLLNLIRSGASLGNQLIDIANSIKDFITGETGEPPELDFLDNLFVCRPEIMLVQQPNWEPRELFTFIFVVIIFFYFTLFRGLPWLARLLVSALSLSLIYLYVQYDWSPVCFPQTPVLARAHLAVSFAEMPGSIQTDPTFVLEAREEAGCRIITKTNTSEAVMDNGLSNLLVYTSYYMERATYFGIASETTGLAIYNSVAGIFEPVGDVLNLDLKAEVFEPYRDVPLPITAAIARIFDVVLVVATTGLVFLGGLNLARLFDELRAIFNAIFGSILVVGVAVDTAEGSSNILQGERYSPLSGETEMSTLSK